MGKGIKVKNTTISGGLTGHDVALGKVFAHRSGANHSIAKQFVKASNPRTQAQNEVRDMFAQTSSGWSGLTEAQRQAWNAEAPNFVNTGIFGNRNQSGKNLYTGVNVALVMAGLPAIVAPAQRTIPASIVNALIAIVNGDINLSYDSEEMYYLGKVQVKMSKPQTAGTSAFPATTILANFDNNANFSQAITGLYQGKYGQLISGTKIFYEIVQVGAGGVTFPLTRGFVLVP